MLDEESLLVASLLSSTTSTLSLDVIQAEAHSATHKGARNIIEILKSSLTSKTSTPSQRLQALQLFIVCMESGNPLFTKISSKKMIPTLQVLSESRFSSAPDKEQAKHLDEFRKSLLGSIERWASNEEPEYYQLYSALKAQGVLFPNEQARRRKKLLRRSRKLSKEITNCLSQQSCDPSSLKEYISLLKRYQSSIQEALAITTGQDEVSALLQASDSLSHCYKEYKSLKYRTPTSGMHHSDIRFPESFCLPDELAPKFPINYNELDNSMTDFAVTSQSSELPEKSFEQLIDAGSDPGHFTDKLADLEDTIQMYRADLLMMQKTLLERVEEKEELRIALSHNEKSCEKLGAEIKVTEKINKNLSLQLNESLADLDSERVKNACLETTVSELQSLIMALVAENSENKNHIQNLEKEPVPYPLNGLSSFKVSNLAELTNCVFQDGLLFESPELSVQISRETSQQTCTVVLKVTNSTPDTIPALSLSFSFCPQGLSTDDQLPPPVDLLGSAALSLEFSFQYQAPFFDYPIFSLSYCSSEYVIALPVTQFSFFRTKLYDVSELWEQMGEYSLVSTVTSTVLLPMAGHPYFSLETVSLAKSYLYTTLASAPVIVKFSANTLEVRCEDPELRRVVLLLIKQYILMQFNID